MRWSERYPDNALLALNLAGMQIIVGDMESAKTSIARGRD